MSEIKYVIGDVTSPVEPGSKILIHCCNDIGAWGSGVVLAISRRWPEPEAKYREWFKTGILGGYKNCLELGKVQFVEVREDLIVANMVGQRGVGHSPSGVPPVRYDAIVECLERVAVVALESKASICAPRFGAGLAGGDWGIIEGLIQKTLIAKGLEVTVYDL